MSRIKSLFGVQGLIYILVAFILVFFGFRSPDVVDDFNIYWMMTGSSFVLGVMLFVGKGGENSAVKLSRIIVGGLFIVSGLIKANDTIGFGFKLEEYFRPQSLGEGWAVFEHYSLLLSIVISGAEVLLGLAILIGAWARLATTLVLVMTVFFAWLTNFTADCVSNRTDYSSITRKLDEGDRAFLSGDPDKGKIKYERAFFKADRMKSPFGDTIMLAVDARREIDQDNPDSSKIYAAQEVVTPNFYWECVEDCGCFGDALKGSVGRSLTPRESFYKDIFLVFFVLILFFKQGKIKLNNTKDDVLLIGGALLLIALFGGGLFGWWFPLIFTLLASVLYYFLKKMTKPGKKQIVFIAILMSCCSYGFAVYTYTFLPIKDYRPYKIGDSVVDNMKSAFERNQNLSSDDKLPEMKYYTNWLWRNKVTGKDTIVVDTSYSSMRLWEDSAFNNMYMAIDYDGEKHVLETGYERKINDFQLLQKYSELDSLMKLDSTILSEIEMEYDPGYSEDCYVMKNTVENRIELVLKTEFKDSLYPMVDSVWEYVKDSMIVIRPPNDPNIDVTDHMLEKDKMLWIISYDLAKANKDKLKTMKAVASDAQKNGVQVAFVSSATGQLVEDVKDETGFYFPYYICDQTELKIVIRSNPGMVYLEKGVVKGKWDHNRVPEFKELK